MRKSPLLIFLLLLCFNFISAQEKKILFIGNSYTFIEDIPNIFYEAANSTGDNLLVETQTAGSATFEFHATSEVVANKINSDNWDFVVLQGSSVEVGLTGDYFDDNVAPYAQDLCETVKNNSSCSQPVFYNTWGREWGMSSTGPTCANYPWMCTYNGMDDEVTKNYRVLADINDAVISPVGPVWRYLRETFAPVDLYIDDESHQTLEGAYASACTFYATLLRKDPTLITYNPGISLASAAAIRNAVKIVVYDQLSFWKIEEFDPMADFTYTADSSEVTFVNSSVNADTYSWDFGDSNTSTEENPIHTYSEIGDYEVELEVIKCGITHTYITTVSVSSLSLDEFQLSKIKVYPNPTQNMLFIDGVDLSILDSIKFYDLLGRPIDLNFPTNKNSADISNLSSGHYFLELKTKNGLKEVRKVLKK